MTETHEPGRVLDVLVAERVMGLTIGKSRVLRYVRMGTTVHPDHVPRYSTDMTTAMGVVDKLMEQAFAVTLYISHDGSCCRVEDGGGVVRATSVDPRDGNMALAICLAALDTVTQDTLSPSRG